MSERIVRLALDPELVESMDSALAGGIGGHRTRSDFVGEAVRSYLMDYGIEVAFATSGARTLGARKTDEDERQQGADALSWSLEIEGGWVGAGRPLDEGLFECDGQPFLGPHNRDLPTLRALDVIGRATQGGAVSWAKLERLCIDDAWMCAEAISAGRERGDIAEPSRSLKADALFPKNRDRVKASEENYVTFALGRVGKTDATGRRQVSGIVFDWGAVVLALDGDELVGSLSDTGAELLERMRGLSPQLPHPELYASRFIEWLVNHSRVDGADMLWVAERLTANPTREELIREAATASRVRGSVTNARTYVTGPLARLRAWGLAEPEMDDGRYSISALGNGLLQRFSN